MKGIREAVCPESRSIFILTAGFALARSPVREIVRDSSDAFPMIVASSIFGWAFRVGRPADSDTLAPGGIQRYFGPGGATQVSNRSSLEVHCETEEALRNIGLARVAVQLRTGLDLEKSRRLQLACRESGVLGFSLTHGHEQASAAEAHWQCDRVRYNNMAWLLSHTRNRRGKVGSFEGPGQ